MENITTANTPNESFNRFAIPIKWGIVWGMLSCVLTTIEFMFLTDSYIVFMLAFFVMFLIGVGFYLLTGFQQRRAMGGFITFKEAFQSIFVVILISAVISGVYGLIYFKYIDPDAMEKVRATTVGFMERVNAPQESIDEAMVSFDKSAEDTKSVGKMAYSLLKGIVISSIFGFICAAIVKKKRPEFGV